MIKKRTTVAPNIRCAIYTRKSSDDGLEQEFNSLDAQRESGEAYVASQKGEGWVCLPDRYDDGGFTGGNMDRPALQRLISDIKAGKIDCVVVYKVDRLSRSLLDFAKLLEVFEQHGVAFVSVTQQFNTANSMGRLMLNVLLSFAQFEREIISERTRDKIAATRRRGKYSGGLPVLGYNVVNTKLVVAPDEEERVHQIFELYLMRDGLLPVVEELHRRNWRTKQWTTKKGIARGGRPFDKNSLWQLLTNVVYAGKVRYKDEVHDGEHRAIVSAELWQRVQAKLQRNGRSGGREVRNKFGALLKGLLHCTACSCAFTPNHTSRGNKRYRYYVCSAAQKQGWKTCPSPSIPAGEIERFVVDQIKCIGRDPQVLASTIRQVHAQATATVTALTAEARRLERELASYHSALQSAVANQTKDQPARLADLQERIDSVERRLTEVRQEQERVRAGFVDDADVTRALADFEPVWDALTYKEQGRLLQLLIERIDYDGSDGTISITFHPSGIQALSHHDVQGDAA